MFDYRYWPEDLASEINFQIRECNQKAQFVVHGETFITIANNILKAQVGEKFFELVVFIPTGHRIIEVANLLHRIVQGGAKVGVFEMEISTHELEQFAIFDSKLLISDKLHKVDGEVYPLLFKKHHEFLQTLEKSQLVRGSSEEIKMKFWANKYFVAKGEEIELSWSIENGNSQRLNPGNFEIQSVGSSRVTIEKDKLFTITSRNTKNKTTLSIFIKCMAEEEFQLTVSVFNRALNDYLKIEPIGPEESSYAVYKGDLIRLDWFGKSAVSLKEGILGKLKNVGYYNFIATENRVFDFEVTMPKGRIKRNLQIFPFSALGSVSTPLIEKESTSAEDHPKLQKKADEKPNSWISWVIGVFQK